ncbi:MAG: hypothetical protein NC911_00745, partial [Candidatus Omnitrophica bacterium]|nr:hypothetical protein [Candidatus Omnitrophota bacterium]
IISSQSKGISFTIINEEPQFQKNISEFLINIITKYTSIDSSNIKIDYSSSNEVPEYLIKLAENRLSFLIKYNLFNETTDNNIIINNCNYFIEPRIIELFFDSRPRTATEKINYSIALNEKIIFKSDAIKSLPEEKLFDLSSYLNQIWDYDSIVIHLEAYDRNNLYKIFHRYPEGSSLILKEKIAEEKRDEGRKKEDKGEEQLTLF